MGKRLAGVLTYRTSGRKRGLGGQTVGADGAGEFAMLVRGTPEKAEKYSRAYIKEMESLGYKIEEVIFVHNGDDYGYFGNPTRIVDA